MLLTTHFNIFLEAFKENVTLVAKRFDLGIKDVIDIFNSPVL